MRKNEWSIIAGVATALSLILMAIPKIFPVCDMMVKTAAGGAMPMRCFYTYQAEFLISLLALLVAVTMFFVKSVEARRLSGLFLILLGIVAILLPQSGVIGICSKAGMACHTTTTWLIGTAILLILAGAYAAFIGSRVRNH